jgi:glutathione synthase/RimK-type ligase-like ATP-grasp enzyme
VNERPVAVVTNTRDLAADDVIRRIADKGYPVVRLNADRPAGLPVWELSRNSSDFGAVWWRQFEPWSDVQLDAAGIDDLLIARAQWRAWLSTLEQEPSRWINPIWAARRAENKIEQLRAASSCGFLVPPTCVVNDRDAAFRFASGEPTVLKTLASSYFEFSGHGFVYTHTLEDVAEIAPPEWPSQPVTVQRAIRGQDIRVVALGERVFGAKTSTTTLDWRLAGRGAEWKPWVVPEQLRSLCRKYLQHFGLRYAAFDFKHDGESAWFLEANQAGEWVFLDRPLGLGIAEALSTYLIELAGA